MKATYSISMMVGTNGLGTIIHETLVNVEMADAIAKLKELATEWAGQIIRWDVYEDGCTIASSRWAKA